MEKVPFFIIVLHTKAPLQKKITQHINISYASFQTHHVLCKLDKVLLTMYNGPVGQYANYIDEGMERANDSQSVNCFYCPPPRADPLTLFDDPQAKGHLSWGQRALPCC